MDFKLILDGAPIQSNIVFDSFSQSQKSISLKSYLSKKDDLFIAMDRFDNTSMQILGNGQFGVVYRVKLNIGNFSKPGFQNDDPKLFSDWSVFWFVNFLIGQFSDWSILTQRLLQWKSILLQVWKLWKTSKIAYLIFLKKHTCFQSWIVLMSIALSA